MRISGIVSTHKRKEVAKTVGPGDQDPNFAISLGHRPTSIANFYSPTPNKLIGTFQYPHPKVKECRDARVTQSLPHKTGVQVTPGTDLQRLPIAEASEVDEERTTSPAGPAKYIPSSKSSKAEVRKKAAEAALRSSSNSSSKYPSYMMRPNWHKRVVDGLKEKGKTSVLPVYEELFQDLPLPTDRINKRLEAVGAELKSRVQVRELKPIHVERVHKIKYEAHIRDPGNRTTFFASPSKDLQAESAMLQATLDLNHANSDQVQLTLNSKTVDLASSLSRLNDFTGSANNKQLKTVEFFEAELNRKNHEKELIVVLASCRLCGKRPSLGLS